MNDPTINAFPIPGLHMDPEFNGLTKMEWFAGMALIGLLSNPEISQLHSHDTEEERADCIRRNKVDVAYAMAEAMLAESERRNAQG